MILHRWMCGLTWGPILIAMASCASPREHLYALNGVASEDASGTLPRATVILGPVSIPQEVDRPQIVVRDGDYHVTLAEQDRWAAPLKDALPRLLAAELGRRATQLRFVPASSGAIGPANARLAVDILRFDVSRTAGATLIARWVYRTDNPTVLEGEVVSHADVTLGGYDGLVDALRRASIDVADRIAIQLPKEPPGKP